MRSMVSAVFTPAQRLVAVIRQLYTVPAVVSLLTELAEDQHLQLSLLSPDLQQGGGYSAARQKYLLTKNNYDTSTTSDTYLLILSDTDTRHALSSFQSDKVLGQIKGEIF